MPAIIFPGETRRPPGARRPTALFFAALWIALSGAACAGAPGGRDEPAWVPDPYAVYPRDAYLAAVGYGSSRDTAEKAALSKLASIFGQSIKSETTTSYTYSQAIADSGSAREETAGIAQTVKTSAVMDTLIGAEIKEVWRNPEDGGWYAAAALDRAKTSLIYLELIEQNLALIGALTNLSEEEKQNMDGFIGCRRAANLADANMVFAVVRNVISPGSGSPGEQPKTGNDYRLEAARIARNIPVTVTVDNDRQTRIRDAFSAALAREGFVIAGGGSRYVLRAKLLLEELRYEANPSVFVRYAVDARLEDTAAGTELFPYSINGREGHQSLSEAENRAIRQAENRIAGEYTASFLSPGGTR
ncbi:MAG: LPP20 family lipoprotein [Treponema sp.]|jgi:hypothetical protein|nr:LPP20 family lipoprotein [Treponema sp.]